MNMKEKILFNFLIPTILIVCVIFGTIVWGGMLTIFVIDDYNKNPNTLFISIPFIIFVHWFGYKVFTKN